MLHRKELKLLKSLAYKKYRDKNNLFFKTASNVYSIP